MMQTQKGGFDKKLIHHVTKHEMAKRLKMKGYAQDTRKVTSTLMKKKRELLCLADVNDKKTEGRTEGSPYYDSLHGSLES